MKRKHTYGWQPDLPDQRDYKFTAPRRKLPASIDLRPKFQPCYDQGDLGSCTANAIAGALEFDQRLQKLVEFTPSRLFIYYNERAIEGTIAQDSGAQIRDGIKAVANLGAPDEKLWPYLINKFASKPSSKVFSAAKKHPAVRYERVPQTLSSIQGALAAGFPVVFGFTVYESFESQAVADSGIVPFPAKSEKVVGGHAVVCVGYTADGHFICRNSWGSDWGQNGYFTLPAAYLLSPNLADDLWCIKQVA